MNERLLAGGNTSPVWIGLLREDRHGLRDFGWVSGERVLSAHWGIQEPRRNPADLALRERTGCSVVAVERGDEVVVDLGPGFRFQPEDAVYSCGSNEGLRRFRAGFGRG